MADPTLHELVEQARRDIVDKRLLELDWHITNTAKSLGCSVRHVHDVINRHGLKRPNSPP